MTSPSTIYLDGNSLGPPMAGVAERLRRFVEDEWAVDLISGWNSRQWWELPVSVGDRIARLVGAAPGQVIVADSTTVMLYKLLSAALRARPGRRCIVTHEANFPTDRHVVDAVARQFGATVEAVPAADLASALCRETAVLCATHVDYRSGARLDLRALSTAAHDVGALALWDLSHSVGAMDLHLDDDGADLAVGCTYKYLNGGPGSPAFAYVARRHLAALDQPLQGWVGHAAPFSMDEAYEPHPSVRRLLSGTPPVMALVALDAALDAFDQVGLAALREHSVQLTDRFIALADEHLASHGFTVVTPRAAEGRGSHVSLAHEHAYEVVQAAIAAGVVGDYREPGLCRFGFAPLYLSLDEVDEAVERLVGVMHRGDWRRPELAVRSTVT